MQSIRQLWWVIIVRNYSRDVILKIWVLKRDGALKRNIILKRDWSDGLSVKGGWRMGGSMRRNEDLGRVRWSWGWMMGRVYRR
jgi:hypothetical protein